MTDLTIKIPDKFKIIISDDVQIQKITSYFVEDYLVELYQDSKTKTELENSIKDKELNKKLKKSLGIS